MSYNRKSYEKFDELEQLKHSVKMSHDAFNDNYKRFHYYRDFVGRSNLKATDLQVLADRQLPQVEANVLPAYISRLLGEWSQMEPSFTINAAEGAMVNPQMLATMKFWGMHMRAILKPTHNDNMLYNLYSDCLTGGFAAAELYVEYVNEMSNLQKICMDRVPDPTLSFWDPMAMASHKGDGAYCGYLVPMSRDGMINRYGEEAVKDIKFTRDLGGFSWSYRTQMDEILLVANYWKKKYKSVRLTMLSNHMTIPVKDYERFAENWRLSGVAETAPIPIGKIRTSKVPTICLYRFTENKIHEYSETSWSMFPLIFFDGNGLHMRDESSGTSMHMTRPYVMQCKDTQKVKNSALQSLANEVENMIQHKYIAPIEGVPRGQEDVYRNPQRSSTLLYNSFRDDDPSVPLSPPQVIPRPNIPSELMALYQSMDQTIQMQLGAYDAALGIQNNELSGVAIQNGAMQSNAASMPYNVGMMQGLNRVANVMLDMIPKVYVTPRSLPVRTPEGKREYVMINTPGNPTAKFDPRDFQVDVEAGVNFNVQKQVSLTVITNLMKASPFFASFFGSPSGAPILLGLVDVFDKEQIEFTMERFVKQQQQQAQSQPNPQQMQMQIEQETIQQRDKASQRDFIAKLVNTAASTSVQKDANDVAFIQAIGKIDTSAAEREIKERELDSENARTAVDMATKESEHELEQVRLLHEISKSGESSEA